MKSDTEPPNLEVPQLLMPFFLDEIEVEGSVETLISWLEKGECSKQSSCKFFSMIQSAFHHAKRLAADKSKQDQEMEKVVELHRVKMQEFLIACKYGICSLVISYFLCPLWELVQINFYKMFWSLPEERFLRCKIFLRSDIHSQQRYFHITSNNP